MARSPGCLNAPSFSVDLKFCWRRPRKSPRQEHFLALAKGARAAGLVLIYSAAELDVSAKHALKALAAKDFFDLTAEPLPADDHAALETILPRFELLRIRRGSGDPEKVN